ncbi:uncharacterized protein LOC124936358 [Impatiens glandulifera]|uniref:uncharacterized protein LOC124936358 n=1 Tax=Impatiens glandulifera TaxID=253017 RepID=UPI001FB0C74A|nr:uncharacterized protein LOC124936358 [Impatiens glandulifera]
MSEETNPSVLLSTPSSLESKFRSLYSPETTSTPRQWRPAAQRNLRNRWSNLAQYRKDWSTHLEKGLKIANSLVNNYLSQRYIKGWEFGVVSDMPDIRKKTCQKLYKNQILDRSKLLHCYKDMVATTVKMFQAAALMRCFTKGIGSPIVKFDFCPDENGHNDDGDGGGIKVFRFLSISSFEKLAAELVEMFALELNLKRLLVVEFLSIDCGELTGPCWSDELYSGEFDDLYLCCLYSKETNKLKNPKMKEGQETDMPVKRTNHQLDRDVLEVYQTTWLAEVNIDTCRLEEIFSEAGEEIQVKFF